MWGAPTDVPVVGDFDGDGKSDIAVWRPSTGYWYIILSGTGATIAKQWGAPTDIPVVGDFDGDGKSDIAVWRPASGYWYIILSSTGATVAQQWGAPTDVPVVGDFDGDGKSDIAVWRPATGYWYIVPSSTGVTVTKQWGAPTDVPVVEDFDGDGKSDIAVWRPATGYWYIVGSATGQVLNQQWGESGDTPVQAPYEGGTQAEMAVWRASDGTWYILSPTTNTTPPPVVALGVEGGTSQITVVWDSSPAQYDVTAYNIYRSTQAGFRGSLLATDRESGVASSMTIIGYVDTTVTAGITYYYTVTAVNATGEGPASPQSDAVRSGSSATLPAAPTGLNVLAGNRQVAINWNPAPSALTYNVYRSSVAGAKGNVVVTTVPTSFLDTSVFNGTTYYYTVTAANSAGEGPPSSQSAAATPTVPSGATYTLGFTLTGLAAGSGITVGVNQGTGTGESIGVALNGTYTFLVPFTTGSPYAVTVVTQPAGETCAVSGGNGTIAMANVVIGVACVPTAVAKNAYVIDAYSGTNGDSDVFPNSVGGNGLLNPLATASIAAGCFPTQIVIDPGNSYVYVVNELGDHCDVDELTGSVSQFTIGANGGLTPMSPATVEVGADPESLAVHPSGKYLYVANHNDLTISQFAIGATGALTPLNPATVATGLYSTNISVDASGRYVYVLTSNGQGGAQIMQYSVGSNGALAPLSPAIVSPSVAQLEALAIDPSGKYVYVTDFSISPNTVLQFVIAPGGGLAPMPIPSVTLGDNPSASGPVIAIDPLSRYAYFAGQSSICQFSIGSTGSLTPLAPACAAESDSTVAIDAMAVDPSGRYLYALGGTGTSGLPGGAVMMYSIGATGALAPLDPSEIRYSSAPVGIAISP